MTTDDYDTYVYQYEGDMEKTSEALEVISAGLLFSEYAGCSFNGFSSYGNGRLTLAGDVTYGLNLEENFKAVRLVVGDKSKELEKSVKGEVALNISQEVKLLGDGEDAQIREIYVEYVTENDVTYRIYPYIFSGSSYQVGDSKEGCYVTQESWLTITKEDGTAYEMILFSDKMYFE